MHKHIITAQHNWEGNKTRVRVARSKIENVPVGNYGDKSYIIF